MNPSQQHKCVAVVWSRFGPYHVARLEACARQFAKAEWRVVGLEVARTDDTYRWSVAPGGESFVRITLFPESRYQELTPRRIAHAVQEVLDGLAPQAVAIVGWSFPEARAALRWCRKAHRPAICMSDSRLSDMPRRWWKEWIKRQVVRLFDSAVVAGTPHVEYAASLGIPRERISLGLDVVDNHYFATSAADVRRHAQRWRDQLHLPERFFLSCARFIPKKNLSSLLAAYSLYQKGCCSGAWDLVVVGSGQLERHLRREAAALGLRGVQWPGFLQIDDLPKYFALASAFVLPSSTEQWGLVVNEAMASGLPVLVSTAAGCCHDLVQDGANGYLFNPLNIQAMAEVMQKMTSLSDVERQAMGDRSQAIVAEWGPERFAHGLWESLVAATRATDRTIKQPNPIARMLLHPFFLSRKQ